MMAELPAESMPTPGPGARFTRGAAQGGTALAFVNLWNAFGWLGADTWTKEEAALRWPAITAVVTMVVVGGQNLFNYLRSKQFAAELRELREALDREEPIDIANWIGGAPQGGEH